MFIYFNENKLAYHKGQLAPFFIVFIIVIIIAALVTINIGKVAKDKTYSANSVDAGVLAAASTMASAFNYIAVANSNMEVNYQYFIGLATISFIIGYVQMAAAMTATGTAIAALGVACAVENCCNSCSYPPAAAAACVVKAIFCGIATTAMIAAQAELALFNRTMTSLIIQVTGYWMLQYFFYRMIRDNINDYHQSALDSGYSFSFSNSGISSKLRGCRAGDSDFCDTCEDACERDCRGRCGTIDDYDDDERDDYSDCIDACVREELNCLIDNCQSHRAEYQLWVRNNTDDVPSGAIRTYSWLDGQGRSHDVATQVMIDSVDDYDLRVTILPFPAEIALLVISMVAADTARATLATAQGMACSQSCAAIATTVGSEAPQAWALGTSIAAHVGLAVNGMFPSSSDSDAWPYLITWIDDVPHNFLVDVYQTQRHQGADLGAWSTEYPLTTSSSQASFAGTGDIHHPDPYYDSTMILTDFLDGHLLPELAEPIRDVEGERGE